MIRAYKYKIRPTWRQRELLQQFFGCTRFIYNWGLAERTRAYAERRERLSYGDLARMLTDLKKDGQHDWLNVPTTECLQQSLRALESAFVRFFREKKGYPRFKAKWRSMDAAKFINSVHFDFTRWRVKVPKVGWVRMCRNEEIDLSRWTVGTLTVSRDGCGEYWATVVCRNDDPRPEKAKPDVRSAVGIDLGVKDFATLSDGTKIPNPRHLGKELGRLAHEQRVLARRKRGSGRWEAQRLKVARLQRSIANRRSDFIHKVTASLVSDERYGTFCLEDLNVGGMMRNHRLARQIADVSWSEFVRVLSYKCENAGKNVLFIGRFEPSSQICHVCGFRNRAVKDLDVREWTCPECGTRHDRDVNAAVNIRNIAFEPQNLIGTEAHKREQRDI